MHILLNFLLTPPTDHSDYYSLMPEHKNIKQSLGPDAVDRILSALQASGASLSSDTFRSEALQGLQTLELKQRVHHLVAVLGKHLPPHFEDAVPILARLPDHWNDGQTDSPWRSFAAWPLIDYIPAHGLQHPELALPLLHDLTRLFSAEFAIRPFITTHPDTSYQTLRAWCKDPDHHVRRLASEGIRPRLPWGTQLQAFIKDPSPVTRLIETLIDDPSDYVRRSVANNLNDIAKDHPQHVITTCQRWLQKTNPSRQWIVRHGTRSLVKSGHPEVFPLLGFTEKPKLHAPSLSLAPTQVVLGSPIQLNASIHSNASTEQSLVIDFALHRVLASGSTSRKVFKWKNVRIAPGETLKLEKSMTLKAISTRNYYPGQHQIELLVNGQPRACATFELKIPSRSKSSDILT